MLENIRTMAESVTVFLLSDHPIYSMNCLWKNNILDRCEQYDIFTQIFQEPLKRDHEFVLLAQRIDWDEITDRLMPFYSKRGRQAKRIRLMVGLHILKHRFDLSDEVLVQGLH